MGVPVCYGGGGGDVEGDGDKNDKRLSCFSLLFHSSLVTVILMQIFTK
jgi:hypothetical protein